MLLVYRMRWINNINYTLGMSCSPIDALIQYRLQIAHRLLNETTLSIEKISDSCGFHSTNYFSRRFRKKYGYAPSQYRFMGK